MSEGCCIGYKEQRTFRKNWNCQVWWHSTVISFRSAGSAWATLRDPCLQQQRAEGVDQQWSTHLDLWGSGFDSQHQKGERVRAHSWSRNSISRWNGEWRDEGDREGDDGANHQGRIKKRKSSFKEKYDRLWKSQVKPEGVWKTGPTDNSSLEGKAATAEMILEPVTVDYAGRAWRTSIEAVIFGRLASTSPAKGGLPFVAFAGVCGINTRTNFKLPACHHWTWSCEGMCPVGSWELLWAGSSSPPSTRKPQIQSYH